MNDQNNSLKQDFILELMVFSPKYNAVNAEELANQLTEEQLKEYLTKLRAINEKEAEDLADLEESNPEEYERRMQEREAAEEEADNAFFTALEEPAVKEAEAADKALEDAEKEIDAATTKTEKEIDDTYKRADDLVTTFFEDMKKEDVAIAPEPQAEEQKPEPSLSEVQDELHKIIQNQTAQDQGVSDAQKHDPEQEKNPDNWQ